jgi:SAM-dependent methyltransferase
MKTTVRSSIYDFPQYYDILFGAEWKAELRFLKACFRKFTTRKVKSVFEPACGTGRLLVKLARAGWQVGGNDLNPRAVAWCNKELAAIGKRSRVVLADMTKFKVERKFDAAFNLISTVRELRSDTALKSHLKCMAKALEPGGIYLMGLHLTPTGAKPFSSEVWKASKGNIKIHSRLVQRSLDLKKRNEVLDMTWNIQVGGEKIRIVDELNYRTWTASQMKKAIKSVKAFESVATFDFNCDIKSPIEVDEKTQDVIFVLRRK